MVIKISQKAVNKAVRAVKSRTPATQSAWWNTKEGDNIIRVFAFLRGDKDPSDEEAGHFFREVWTHSSQGAAPTLCQNSPARTGEVRRGDCPECEAAERRYAEVLASTDDKKKAREAANWLQSRPRFAFIVVPFRQGNKDMDPKYQRPSVFKASKTTGEAIVKIIMDPDYGGPEAWLGCNGRNIKINYDKTREPSKQYEVYAMDREVSKPLPEKMQDQAQAMDLYSDESLEPNWFLDSLEGAEPETPAGDDAKAKEYEEMVALKAEAEARLEAAGLTDTWEVEIAHDGNRLAPCYYKKGSNDGTWDFPGDAQ